ncbi:hypothetical protein EKO27_g3798 [Xylaria grammica]|uniref:Uncharacterized protein n=1 Tax=Xylaria grammica TaxID=363999 RepID=A0A439DA69_9PEZI|nr:hypothetical protein EKO27_g3798 [Xylaria grammica]
MADEQNTPNLAVNRLEQEMPLNEHEVAANIRQQHDLKRLQQLSIGTTSGDTLVIVRFPAGNFVDCNGDRWETKEFLMESEQLLATGSSVFAKGLSPKAQAQTRRRFNNNHISYRYVLDLTPQIEGDESASEVLQLSLSDGVRDWWRSHFTSNVSKLLVYGHDDNCPHHLTKILSEAETSEKQRRTGTQVDIGELETPRIEKILDYCPIRHRVAILRLLMAIRHGDLILNSAPRTATMAVIAKHFDCVEVVKDHILTWLVAEPNESFIEINAEDALKYAWILELSDVARVAFQLLVVEKAVEILQDKKGGTTDKGRRSIFGRPHGTVTDEQETCIQHAAQKLIQRAEDLGQLWSSDVNADFGIRQWPITHGSRNALRTYIHRIWKDTATTQIVDASVKWEYSDRNRARYVSAAELVPTQDIYVELSPTQRILTGYFWHSLNILASSRAPSAHLAGVGLFDMAEFHRDFIVAVSALEGEWTWRKLEVNILRTGPLIMGLSDEELKFLPLWAGGLDDGTGGVYQTEIPDAVRGFPIGPGPSFYTGETIPDDQTSTSAGNETATMSTGEGTVTMTQGYSIGVTPSRITGSEHEDTEKIALVAASAGLSLTTARNLRATSGLKHEMVLPAGETSAYINDDFDWLADGSERQNLSDLDNSDVDFEDPDDGNADNTEHTENTRQ